VRNQGKGASVKNGALHSKGKKILFLDADGATDEKEILPFMQKLNFT